MIDCEKCKYYHDNCDSKFRCRIDVEKIRADVIDKCISNIDKLTTYYAGDKEGNALTPKVVIKEDVIKVLEQLKEQRINENNITDNTGSDT